MTRRKTSPWLLALLALALAGRAGAAEIAGRIDLVDDKGQRATGVHRTVVYFTPRAGAPRPEPLAGPFEVVTVRKKFEPTVAVVPVGSTVAFPNQDPILHNAFSVSGENRFDLGLYRGGESRETKFDTPGVVQVFCNVHHSMAAYVVVVDTPYYTSPETNGEFLLQGVPEGSGTLTFWHEQTETVTRRIDVPTAEPLAVALKITKKRIPRHLNKFGKPYSRKRRGKAY